MVDKLMIEIETVYSLISVPFDLFVLNIMNVPKKTVCLIYIKIMLSIIRTF